MTKNGPTLDQRELWDPEAILEMGRAGAPLNRSLVKSWLPQRLPPFGPLGVLQPSPLKTPSPEVHLLQTHSPCHPKSYEKLCFLRGKNRIASQMSKAGRQRIHTADGGEIREKRARKCIPMVEATTLVGKLRLGH